MYMCVRGYMAMYMYVRGYMAMYMYVRGYMAMYMCVRGYMAMYMCVRGYDNHCFYYYSILFCGIILFCFFILWQHESRHYIVEIFLTLALNTNQPINQSTTWISNERPCLCVSGINFTSGSMIIWFELLNSSNCYFLFFILFVDIYLFWLP